MIQTTRGNVASFVAAQVIADHEARQYLARTSYRRELIRRGVIKLPKSGTLSGIKLG